MTIWEIALYEVFNFIMKNNFLNNNGANLRHTSKKLIKKTQVEIQSITVGQNRIDELRQQEQVIIKELNS
jgi:hypothetical protein